MNIFVMVLFCASVPFCASSYAQSPEVKKKFNDCILSEAKRNTQYTSSDGGRSAMLLAGSCGSAWEAWVNGCMAAGGSDSDCTTKSVIIAQAALKLLDR